MFEFPRLFFLTWRLLQRSLPHQQDHQGTVHQGVCQTQDHQPQIRLLHHTGNSTSIFTISCTMLRFSSERTRNCWRKEALLFWGELAGKYMIWPKCIPCALIFNNMYQCPLQPRSQGPLLPVPRSKRGTGKRGPWEQGALATVHDHALIRITIITILLYYY